MTSSKQVYFQGPYHQQNWALPDTVIFYITKTPISAKGYQKLIQTCKYFYAKNSIFVVEQLYFGLLQQWDVYLNKEWKRYNFPSVSCKLWIADRINLFSGPSNYEISVSTIIPKLYSIGPKRLSLCNQRILFKEFLFFSSNAEIIELNYNVLRNENDAIVSLEEIVKVLPKIKNIYFADNSNFSSITTNTVKELLELPHFTKIDKYRICNLPELFDIVKFFDYLKKNTHTHFYLDFGDTISNDYEIYLESIIDEIIATKNHGYKIPAIYFDGIPTQKWNKISSLFHNE